MVDHKGRAARVWGATPAGSRSSAAPPGSREFFEEAEERRRLHEMPWLTDVIPFGTFRAKRVLEVGCGVGFDAVRLIESGADYVGVDITPENIDRATAHLSHLGIQAEIHVGDAEQLQFRDAQFDVYFSNGVLHHTPHFARALREANRVLRPGGDAWIVVYNRNSIFYWLTLFLEHYVIRREYRQYAAFADRLARIEFTTSDITPIVRAYTRAEIRRESEIAGFQWCGSKVRKLNREDLPTLPILSSIWPHVPQCVLDRLGKRVGWYVVAHFRKPA
jgi:ubiquinone/menaquinone biosynthesis C-methylase UbiE